MSTWRIWVTVPPQAVPILEDAIESTCAFDSEPPSISSFEIKEHETWQVEAYFTSQPDMGLMQQTVSDAARNLGLTLAPLQSERLQEKDWVSESQKLLHPVTAGRIFVHGSHDRKHRRPYGINLQIEAGQAFGTGQHATTLGCLLMLHRLARYLRPTRLCDLGCGSGVLSMTMARIWNKGVLASDIDPIATQVCTENATINSIRVHGAPVTRKGMSIVTAAGTQNRLIQRHGPYDLVTANILAGPLIDMAHDIARIIAPGGRLILAGLLVDQEAGVMAAYRSQGLVREARTVIDGWPALLLKRPHGLDTKNPGLKARAVL